MVRHIHLVQLHGFGQRYYLPAPLFLYLFASVVVVVLSFVLAAALEGSSTVDPNRPYPRWRAGWLLPIATSRPLLVACRVLGPVLLGIVIVTALAGPPDPLQNAAAYLIWIYAWVVLALLAAAIGNLWALINPFDAIYQGLVRLFHLNGPRRILPERAGIWPAVLLFLLVAWFELASGLATSMTLIGWGTIAYTVLTVSGMLTFGSQQWLSRAEIFTVLTDIASRLGPTEVERDAKGQACASWLRPWGAGLLGPVEGGWDRIAFLILMLSNLAFDGIESTPQWSDFATGLKPQLTSFFGGAERTVLYTSGLLITALLFFVVF
ncbi:MAG TPA: hypothetical protein VG015_09600, partial [Candidatus Dormibacteraeota bacterium]|nr:hypothetical protein [Candidatus Dormibacteraeota bacterium]